MQIDNDTESQKLDSIQVVLQEKLTLIANRSHSYSHVKDLVVAKCGTQCEPKKKLSWKDGLLIVPSVMSSSNGLCKLIDLKYFVYTQITANGGKFVKDFTIPITIGKFGQDNNNNM